MPPPPSQPFFSYAIYDHQHIVLFSIDDLPPTKHKYITIKSNTDEAIKALFCTSFKNKHIIDQLDTNIHNTDPNHNYEILKCSLIETQSECCPDRVVRFNNNKMYARRTRSFFRNKNAI